MENDFIDTSELPKETPNGPVGILGGNVKTEVKFVEIEYIYLDPEKTPKNYKTEELASLAMDILKNGLQKPIVVIELGDDFYQIISGEKRFRACLLARFEKILCAVMHRVVKNNNISIPPKNYFEKAKFYSEAINRGLYTEENIALKLRSTPEEISSMFLLLSFSDEEQEILLECGVPEKIAIKLAYMDINTRKGFLETMTHGTNVPAVCAKISEVYSEKYGEEKACEGPRKIKFGIKGNAFFLNSIERAVKTMRGGGINVDYKSQETEYGTVLTLIIPKN